MIGMTKGLGRSAKNHPIALGSTAAGNKIVYEADGNFCNRGILDVREQGGSFSQESGYILIITKRPEPGDGFISKGLRA